MSATATAHVQAQAPRPNHQAGFTLIEFMIAIFLSLIIAAGMASIVQSMSRTFRSQDSLSQTQDGERLFLTMLHTAVQAAGYFVDPVNFSASTALIASTAANADGTSFTPGQAVVGTDGTSSTVNVRYQAAVDPGDGSGLMNCQGTNNTGTVAVIWVNSFAVNANNELVCSVNGNTALPLISNVASMTVVYGVDTDSDGSADTYLPANLITSGGLWLAVISVKVTVNFVNISNVGSAPSLTQTVNLMNGV